MKTILPGAGKLSSNEHYLHLFTLPGNTSGGKNMERALSANNPRSFVEVDYCLDL